MKNILIYGPYPPPPGGVANHIARLSSLLQEIGYCVDVIDTQYNDDNTQQGNIIHIPRLRNLITIPLRNYSLIHLHFRSKISTVLLTGKAKLINKKIVISFHNERIISEVERSKLFYKVALSLADAIIVTRQDVRLKILELLRLNREKIYAIDACLPLRQNGKEFTFSVDEVFKQFTGNHFPIVLGYSHRLDFYNGEDLYGIDLLIKAISVLREEYRSIGLYLRTPTPNEEFHSYTKNLIDRSDISDAVYWSDETTELLPLIRFFHLYVRPTNTDGDSVLVREALMSGIPCVASDAVWRPKECVLFKNRDLEDLVSKIRLALREGLSTPPILNRNFEKILEVYEGVYNRRTTID